MKILKIIGLVLVAIILIAAVYASMQPATGELERSIVIDRPAEMVYEQVSTMKNFNNWSPWFTIDPETKYTYEGPESGVGAKMSWESDHPDVGAGSQWIIGTKENEEVNIELDFGMDGKYYSDMLLEPVNEGTKVTWVYKYEDLGLISKFFIGVMDVEAMVGDSYKKGLQDLKTYLEVQPIPEPEKVAEPADSVISE